MHMPAINFAAINATIRIDRPGRWGAPEENDNRELTGLRP
jgi:hypothetical protein